MSGLIVPILQALIVVACAVFGAYGIAHGLGYRLSKPHDLRYELCVGMKDKPLIHMGIVWEKWQTDTVLFLRPGPG